MPQNKAEAEQWYLKSAALGNTNGAFALGQMYKDTDKDKAIHYLKLSQDLYLKEYGNTSDVTDKLLRELGVEYRPLRQTADVGGHATNNVIGDSPNSPTNAIDQYNLGIEYDRTKDYAKAAYWYEKAAEQGFAKAQFNIGFFYNTGQGVNQDYAKAAYWYEKAARQGFDQAQYNLGVCYYYGEGVNQDYTKAAYWYEKAARQGFAQAQYNLGVCYYYREGVNQDYTKAAYWFEKAAQQGLANAQYNLGKSYYLGEGVDKNLDKAIFWMEKAEAQGVKNANVSLIVMKRLKSEQENK